MFKIINFTDMLKINLLYIGANRGLMAQQISRKKNSTCVMIEGRSWRA